MSEKKFTPGPWATHFVGHGESAYADILQASDTNVVIATCGPTAEELANAHLIAAAPDLYDALETASLWMWNPDENSVESFERINKWFMNETGYMRPGKSYPLETPPPDNLQQIWDEWRTQKSRDVLLAMRAALAKARGEA